MLEPFMEITGYKRKRKEHHQAKKGRKSHIPTQKKEHFVDWSPA
jgi:hypothetical protein